MHSIRLKSLKFETPAFRKLADISMPVAERITLIAGHNGIGKSTILGLIANGSGVKDKAYQSYLNRPFDANLNEIVHLDHAKEFDDYKAKAIQPPSPQIEYDLGGAKLIKRCSVTSRTATQLRVVPRNVPYQEMDSPDGSVTVGKDAKVPLPTLYLGMTRMLPVGESNPAWVKSDPDKTIHPDDAEFIQAFTSSVIGTGLQGPPTKTITTQSIKGTRKTAKHPDYAYSAKCISLGQDSLSAIATALASFKMLQREWPEYPGGLLVVDELDAGFHPHAQQRLMKAIANAAKKFDLQVLATTHSMCLIEAIHPDKNPVGRGGKHVDSVVYLTDTNKPRIAENYSYEDIRRDMSLIPHPVQRPPKAKHLKIYLEDAEANFFLKRLLTASLKRRVKREAGVGLKPIPISMGCDNLKGAHKHDPYFRTVLIAVDADSPVSEAPDAPKHIVNLPGAVDPKTKKGLSPERSLFAFIQDLAANKGTYPSAQAALKEMKLTSNYLHEHLLDGYTALGNRDSAKNWMKARLDHIEEWRLVELWLKEHPKQVKDFEDSLVKAAIATAKLALAV